MDDLYREAAKLIAASKNVVAFTGAGISAESGIPVFRGPNGLWNKYDPKVLELSYFFEHSEAAWNVIKEIFYEFLGKVKPNYAHYFLGQLERAGHLRSVITQNIDNLHQEGGNRRVLEFHGTYKQLQCTECYNHYPSGDIDLNRSIPKCPSCGGILKPDFIFFGEAIPEPAGSTSVHEATVCDLMIVIGTTGEVMPASMIPHRAKENGAVIIEVNTEASYFTDSITDIFLKGKATEVFKRLNSNFMNLGDSEIGRK